MGSLSEIEPQQFLTFPSYLFSVLSIGGYNGQVLLRNELSKHSL